MQKAICKAKESNVAIVGMVQAYHIGRLGEYSEMAAEQEMVSMVFGSGYAEGLPSAVPFGGREKVLQSNPIAITDQVQIGGFETYEANGLPFYAGVVEYETSFELDTIPDSDSVVASLDFQATFLAACEVSINHSDWQPLLWSPYTCTIPKDHLNTGTNTLRIRVYTSLIRSFEGQRFNHDIHSQENIL